ncbi:MAG: translation initiation factor IF-2 [Planctomycetota bacterium]|jgi:translation initiation factor IF-2|nr:translation initiation factor IF-2 [Planctomycetota bacterium]
MRLHELAKKHGFNQQDLLTAVQKEGFDVKNTLMVVDTVVETWVSEKAKIGWTPPSPEKKVLKKKKLVLVKPGSGTKPGEGESETASPVPGQPEAVTPQATPNADLPEEPPVVVADTPEPVAAGLPASPPPTETPTPDKTADTEVIPVVEEKAPPLPIKRVNAKIRGTAVVGQVSAETMAAIKRTKTPSSGQAPAAKTGGRRESAPPPAPERPRGGKPQPARVEPIIPETDLSGKPRVKQRLKTRERGSESEEEALERKNKAAKRGKEKRQDWGIEDDFETDFEEPSEDTPAEPTSGTAVIETIASDLIANEEEAVRSGFKHKRADFKSKRMQHELPASFTDISNDFARGLGGGGRRRSSRGTAVRHNTGRRSRTRRIVGPVQRVPGQAAIVYLGMTLRDLSVALGVKLQEILGWMIQQGKIIQVNDILAEGDINLVAEHFKIEIKWEVPEDLEQDLVDEAHQQDVTSSDTGMFVERPPVVTFMGHVDHGKTSLLDCIRNTRVVDGEYGGITQHIGAYSVKHGRKQVTFLDTPGHEAFSAMRARGANLTDVAVLVVAADDGVMPQTEEAAVHAKNAGVPIVVAINKCDLPSANPARVRQELANRLSLLPEEWGGQVGMVEVSAVTRSGIDGLLERILLEAEVLELRANPTRPATGFVVEARMSEGQGVVATMLVMDGTLHAGDIILCSSGYGKIRFMLDEFGKPITAAGPGAPVRLSGLSSVPEAGDKFFILDDLLKARAIAEQRERESRAAALAKRQHVTLENLTTHLAGSGKRELNVIIKADVVGSLEVIEKTLHGLATEEVSISIIHSAVGGINRADVILADASDAIIIGFHVGMESQARLEMINLGVQVKAYHIIYRMIEDMRAALEGLLPPEEKEVVQGHLEIRQVFRASKIGAIAGCYVTDGVVQRASRIRLYRNQVVVYDGVIQSLKRLKDDAREVKAGFECGVKIHNYDGIEEGDVIEAFVIEEVARKL